MNFTEKMTIPSTIFMQTIDNEMIILDTKSENYFGLDSMGTVMWEQLSRDSSIEVLVHYMLEHYDVEENIVKQDISVFIKNLVKNELIILG